MSLGVEVGAGSRSYRHGLANAVADDRAVWTVGSLASGYGESLTRHLQGRKGTFKSGTMTAVDFVAPVAGVDACVVDDRKTPKSAGLGNLALI